MTAEEKKEKWKKLLSSDTFKPRTGFDKTYDRRTAFDCDYSRVIGSSSFRRLQDKAQVFPLKRGDFVRTRLTHSLEVSHFGHSIGLTLDKILGKRGSLHSDYESGTLSSILATSGLLHDIGNPPFGHFGETAIKDFFKNFLSNECFYCDKTETYYSKKKYYYEEVSGSYERTKDDSVKESFDVLTRIQATDFLNFDGNVQGFRIARRIQNIREDFDSYNLTFPVLATIIKYPCNSSEIVQEKEKDKYKKYGYFQTEKESYEKIIGTLGLEQQQRYPLTYLLEAADDIAYSVADIEDGHKKGIIDICRIKKEFENYLKKLQEDANSENEKFKEWYVLDNDRTKGILSPADKELVDNLYKDNSKITKNYHLFKAIQILDCYITRFEKDEEKDEERIIQNFKIYIQGELIKATITHFLQNEEQILDGTYNEENKNIDMLEDSYAGEIKKAIKKIANAIFKDKSIVEAELLGYNTIYSLLTDLVSSIFSDDHKKGKTKNGKVYSLISSNYKELYGSPVQQNFSDTYRKLLLVTDFVSGMTDSYALDLYKKLNGYQIF